MNASDLQAWLGILGVILGAGIGYGALVQRITSLEARTKQLEGVVSENEKEHNRKLDLVLESMNRLGTSIARIEERIHKSL